MPYFYRIAADAVVVFHSAYVAFVVLGLVLTLIGGLRRWHWVRNAWFRGVHLAMILVVVVEAWWGVTCPLTTLENSLRRRAGQSSYRGDFVAKWVHDILFFDAPPWVFTAVYTLFGLGVLWTFLAFPPRPLFTSTAIRDDKSSGQ